MIKNRWRFKSIFYVVNLTHSSCFYWESKPSNIDSRNFSLPLLTLKRHKFKLKRINDFLLSQLKYRGMAVWNEKAYVINLEVLNKSEWKVIIRNMQDCNLQTEAFQELLFYYILIHPLVVSQACHLSFSHPEPYWRLLWTPQLRLGHWHPIHQTLAMVYPFPV